MLQIKLHLHYCFDSRLQRLTDLLQFFDYVVRNIQRGTTDGAGGKECRNYKISFYEINEFPPKVTLRVEYGEDTRALGFDTQDYEFTITKDMVAILEGRG
jgi:hypothetical protein